MNTKVTAVEISNRFNNSSYPDAKEWLVGVASGMGIDTNGMSVPEIVDRVVANSSALSGTVVSQSSVSSSPVKANGSPVKSNGPVIDIEPEPEPKKEPKPEEKSDTTDPVALMKKQAEELNKKADELKKQLDAKAKEKAKAMAAKREPSKEYKGKHKDLDTVVKTVDACGLAYLVGPAGTGKSTLAADVCEVLCKVDRAKDATAFNKVFAQLSFSPDTTSGEMLGRTDVNGKYHMSDVVRVYRDGGVILFDEIDNADSSMLVKLNSMIANGLVSTPDGVIKRNDKAYFIVTANTFGTGPNSMYVGRTRLDASTLDRFTAVQISIDYDRELESNIVKSANISDADKDKVLDFMGRIRNVILTNNYKRVMSTRFAINAVKLLPYFTFDEIEKRYLASWSDAERSVANSSL